MLLSIFIIAHFFAFVYRVNKNFSCFFYLFCDTFYSIKTADYATWTNPLFSFRFLYVFKRAYMQMRIAGTR